MQRNSAFGPMIVNQQVQPAAQPVASSPAQAGSVRRGGPSAALGEARGVSSKRDRGQLAGKACAVFSLQSEPYQLVGEGKSVRRPAGVGGRASRLAKSDRRYVYRWNRHGRKGEICKLTARGARNSIRVEFADGFVMITSGNSIKRAP